MTTTTESMGALQELSDNLAGAVIRAGRSVVGVNGRSRLPSSGIVWKEGIVVTADHTLERDEGVTVILPDGRDVAATVAGRDPSTDIAVLRIEGESIEPAELGDASTLGVGHLVLAVGRPGKDISASMGAVSTVGSSWRTWAGGEIDRLIRPDLTLYPGFSGGALVDARGQVAGMVTSGLSRNLALAIPASTIERVTGQLLQSGRIARGYLGVGMQPVKLPASLGVSQESGLIVVSVEPGSPAEQSGLLVGDIIVTLDGQGIQDTRDVQSHLGPASVGKSLSVHIIRGGEARDVSLSVGERPARGA